MEAVNRKYLLLMLSLGLLGFAGTMLYQRVSPILFPETVTTLPPDPGCNLRAGPCTTKLADGGSISFSIEPRTIPALAPLALTVQLDGIDARKVEVDFSGTDMFMGFNRIALHRQSQRRYVGQGALSVCVRNAMEWEAKVLVETATGSVSAPYRFIVIKPEL